MELLPPVVDALLERWPVARLATVGPDGPRQVPVVFARAGGVLWSPIDGKPKAAGEPARVRHVRSDPRVSLLVDHYADDWRRLWWIAVSGHAAVVQPADASTDREVAVAVAALRVKYPHYAWVAVLRDPPTLIRIEPASVRSWCAGPEALSQASAASGVPA